MDGVDPMDGDTRDRRALVSGFYDRTDEDGRLGRSRHGQLEYRTTMSYIHRYARSGSRVLEIGAGTGRYSLALAEEGMDVTAVELAEGNLAKLKEKAKGRKNLRAYQGDATDLGLLADDSFDATLVLGPMYHLYEAGEVGRAIDEAVRVTKPGGAILFAFLSVYALMYANSGMTGRIFSCLTIRNNPTRDVKTIHPDCISGIRL